MKPTLAATCLLFIAAASTAQTATERAMPVPSAASIAATKVLTAGVVQRIDPAAGTVTLRHEAVTNRKMAAATTTFAVADRNLLAKVHAGERVRFHVEIVNGAPTLTYLRHRR